VHSFTQGFQQRFGEQPDETAALGYDAVRVLVHAMRASGSVVPGKVAESLRGVRDWPGVTGVFTFSDAGTRIDPTVNTAIIHGGRSHALVDVATAPACRDGTVTAATW
jgi:ABC-type branched-subunit amino acid transport system substrate-binding protein